MAVQMIIKNADTEKKVVGKKNIIDEINGVERTGDCETPLCRKRVAGSNNKILLIKLWKVIPNSETGLKLEVQSCFWCGLFYNLQVTVTKQRF